MLLAIDVGNTNIVFALHDGSSWRSIWRRRTDTADTVDEIAVWLRGAFGLSEVPWHIDRAICGSVVPAMDELISRVVGKWLHVPVEFLRNGDQVGLTVTYEPPTAVGADRLANALAALDRFPAPIIVVDFGTATTFDAIDEHGRYVGGAIMPGVRLSSQALFARAAKLSSVELQAPERAVGRNTAESMRSGIMFGYAGAVEALIARLSDELGLPRVIATGGLGSLFLGLCPSLESHEPTLTLDGLRIAAQRMAG